MTLTNPPAQFSPLEVLEAGHRAAAEGRHDFARQFYQHVMQYYPNTDAGQAASEALSRLGGLASGAAQSDRRRPSTEQHLPAVRSAAWFAPAGVRSPPAAEPFEPPAPHADYRLGRWLARGLAASGGAATVGGVVLVAVAVVEPRILPDLAWSAGVAAELGGAASDASSQTASQTSVVSGWPGVGLRLLATGLGMLVLGQALRALFELANANRDLAALQRARAAHEREHAAP